MMLCLDLCSGTGGFSQAFLNAGWDVIRIDNNERFKNVPNTIIADVCDIPNVLKIISNRKVNVILVSPPCERFSLMGGSWPKEGIGKAMAIVGACLDLVVALKPDYWVLENPKARLRWFLGKPKTTIRQKDYGGLLPKPTDLWGNVCLPMLQRTTPPMKGHGPTERRRLGVPMLGSNSAKNAEIPLGLSQTILEAVSH
jgi:site-specific DNA-cytosine methylase